MKADHIDRYTVRSYEVTHEEQLRPVALLRMLQETAWNHARILGKGFSQRAHGELFWVLARLRVSLRRYPVWGESFTIRTYPVGTERLLAVREFVLCAEDEEIGAAWSGWLIVDGGGGRPIRPQSVVADVQTLPGSYQGSTARLPAVEEAARIRSSGAARLHDIDQYRHVNNASYLEWVLDALAPHELPSGSPHEIHADFLRETFVGQNYHLLSSGDGLHEIRHEDGTVAVRIRLAASTIDPPDGQR